MGALETASRLAEFERRGPGTDAERRAARWLADEVGGAGRQVRIEPFWCRTSWALTHAWHAALALAGSLISVASPRVGAVLLLIALIFVLADAFIGSSPGRRLTPEHASQNVVATPHSAAVAEKPVRLIITANYDAGRMGLVYRRPVRRAASALRRITAGLAPGWLGWLCISMLWLLGIAILRLEGHKPTAVGIAQLIPTAGLVLTVALLLDLATSEYGPAAGDNATGVAVAVALARALDAAPPSRMSVELVLAGAGEAGGVGLRRYLRARRGRLRAANAVVLGVGACGAGAPRWWASDGPLLPLRYFPRLRQLAVQLAEEQPQLGAAPHRGRGATPALQARYRRLPAIAIGCLDQEGLVPRSHQPEDTAAAIDPAAIDSVVQFGLMLVDSIDALLASTQPPQPGVPTPA